MINQTVTDNIFGLGQNFKKYTLDMLQQLQLSESSTVIIQSVIVLILIFFIAWLVDKLATKLFRKMAPRLTGWSKNQWDDILLKNKIFANLSHFLPGIVLLIMSPLIASEYIFQFIGDFVASYFIIVALIFINSVINAAHDIYMRYNEERAIHLNIKIFLQLIKVVLFSCGLLAIISLYTGKSFLQLLAGLGTMLTIILIVYKDTILGFIAGIKLTAYEMVKIGDWIQLPKENADGRVIDISLNTVKVRNWDQTITTVPTYKLVSEPFTNWIGMEESGGRQILRSIHIDMESIRFLSVEEMKSFTRFPVVKEFIENRLKQIEVSPEGINLFNQHSLTNVGLFRRYIENYILSTNLANPYMDFFVRQKQSDGRGLPLELYIFVKKKKLSEYEKVQAELFDHLFAIVPEFGLRIFQEPSGYDIREIKPK